MARRHLYYVWVMSRPLRKFAKLWARQRPSHVYGPSFLSMSILTAVQFVAADKSVPQGQNGPIPISGTSYHSVPVTGTGSQENPKPVPMGLYQTHLRKSAARMCKPHPATYANGGGKNNNDQSQSGSKGGS
ncbi:hypothetical protein DFH08DRAFT_816975 [Mycena albidolilacea]|uniref:Uncharacterized protein n=1 Tax=Mycena albidolilacea TaxID=1033008 RepID=A0AAD7EIX5_9AGAR|nr:hypothetical protein DFH08DRAFT_816975 [Mycena albidolilacea]